MTAPLRTPRPSPWVVLTTLALLLLFQPWPARSADWDSLNREVMSLYQQGQYDRAIQVAKQALALAEQSHGPEHPDVATSLNNLALLYKTQGQYAQAEPLYQRALAIKEKSLGPQHPKVATSLNNLAALYRAQGQYAQAEPLYQRALAVREKALGPEHPDVATSLNNLALLYKTQGQYAQAEPLYKRALAIREKALGSVHPDVATSLNNLAALYQAQGRYAQAEPMYQRALAIDEKALGRDHPDVATDLNNLALLYQAQGQYAQAEPLYQRSLAILEKALGPEHPHVAASLNNLAALYDSQGRYAQAEPLHKRALAIREKALGREHPAVAGSLNNLALLYKTQGQYAQAEPMCQRALAIREKALGPEHPAVATSLNSLAALYQAQGRYAQAEPMYQRALAIDEKALGRDHPDVATDLNNLAALLYQAQGQYAQAEPLYKRALAIDEKALGRDHPDVATDLNNLAALQAARGRYPQAHQLQMRAQAIAERLIEQILGMTAEDQAMQFLATQQGDLEAALSLVAVHLAEDPQAGRDALDLWLRRKGVILQAQRRFQEALVYGEDPQAVRVFQELSRVRSQLSALAFGKPPEQGLEAYRRNLAELEQRSTELQAELARHSEAYARQARSQRADHRQVAQGLPPNSALLEFAHIDHVDFHATGLQPRWLPAHYLAFVLPAGQAEAARLLDLGPAEPIEQAVAAFRKAVIDTQDARGASAQAASRKLYDLVFAPLLPALGQAREVFVSPDGQLNLVPFEVLSSPQGRYLIEDFSFNYLASGRDVLGFGQLHGQAQPSLLLGDPDFDLAAAATKAARQEPSLASSGRRSLAMRGLNFERLPDTLTEVQAIARLFGAQQHQLKTGKEALEAVLLQARAPRILHLATHGFFLSDQDLRELGVGDWNQSGSALMMRTGRRGGGTARLDNPLLRSGLALAGANAALKSTDPNQSQGLLTAEKVLGLRLKGTEVVVLSACDTGVGEVKNGEGVFGLRRAFVQTGTKGLVMSLWSVPDQETRELMVGFYQHLLAGKLSRGQALRQSMLKQMAVTKARYGAANPFYWGAFVYLGEP